MCRSAAQFLILPVLQTVVLLHLLAAVMLQCFSPQVIPELKVQDGGPEGAGVLGKMYADIV